MTNELFIEGLRRTVVLLKAARLELLQMQIAAGVDEASYATEEYLAYECADMSRLISKYEHMIELSK